MPLLRQCNPAGYASHCPLSQHKKSCLPIHVLALDLEGVHDVKLHSIVAHSLEWFSGESDWVLSDWVHFTDFFKGGCLSVLL